MKTLQPIIESMIRSDLGSHQEFTLRHLSVKKPHRIDVARDEVVYIETIQVQATADFWMEYHSSTESRFFGQAISQAQTVEEAIISRHKGNVYFTTSGPYDFEVHYIILKIIR